MDEIVKVELRGDIPIRIIQVPTLYDVFAKELKDEKQIEQIEMKYTRYYRHHEEPGLCGLKYVHFKEVK